MMPVQQKTEFRVSKGLWLTSSNAVPKAGFTTRGITGSSGLCILVNQSIEHVGNLFIELVELLFGNSGCVDVFIEDHYFCRKKEDCKRFSVLSAELGIFLSKLQYHWETFLDDCNVGFSLTPVDELDVEIALRPEKVIWIYLYDGNQHTLKHRIKMFLRTRGLQEDDHLMAISDFQSRRLASEALRDDFERFLLEVNASSD